MSLIPDPRETSAGEIDDILGRNGDKCGEVAETRDLLRRSNKMMPPYTRNCSTKKTRFKASCRYLQATTVEPYPLPMVSQGSETSSAVAEQRSIDAGRCETRRVRRRNRNWETTPVGGKTPTAPTGSHPQVPCSQRMGHCDKARRDSEKLSVMVVDRAEAASGD